MNLLVRLLAPKPIRRGNPWGPEDSDIPEHTLFSHIRYGLYSKIPVCCVFWFIWDMYLGHHGHVYGQYWDDTREFDQEWRPCPWHTWAYNCRSSSHGQERPPEEREVVSSTLTCDTTPH